MKSRPEVHRGGTPTVPSASPTLGPPTLGPPTRSVADAGAGHGVSLLSGWGRTGSVGAQVVRVRTAQHVADLYRRADDRGVLARGLGRSYGDAAQNAGGLVLDMTGLDMIGPVDHASMTVRVGAGVDLGRLMRRVIPQGLALPVVPGTASVTVGGAIACDVHGKNHLHVGSFASNVVSVTVVLPSGETMVVTPADPEVFWATAGGMGLTGVIVEAVLRLRRTSTAHVVTSTRRCPTFEGLLSTLAGASASSEYAVAWLDVGAAAPGTGRGVVESGDAADQADMTAGHTPPVWMPARALQVPAGWPAGTLSWPAVRALGAARWAGAARHPRTRVRALVNYLCPLDRVSGWHRFYGRSGLLQYQLAVPAGSEDVLARTLRRVAAGPAPCALAVLKRLGPQPGLLSFPIDGWTLSLDLPAGVAGMGRLLATLDEDVIGGGGRIYLAKDSRLGPGTVARMYPRLGEWQAIRQRLDPAGALVSDLARRTHLVPTPGGGHA